MKVSTINFEKGVIQMVTALPKVKLNGEEYYVDARLTEFRKVDNPHERIPFNDPGHTPVYSTATGECVALYSLPPKEAVVAAWEQHHRNFNTWEYAKKIEEETYPLEEGKYGWTLGNFWAPFNKSLKQLFKEE